MILNVRNRGTIAGLPDDAVVEVPTMVDANGVHPLTLETQPDLHQLGLMQQIKAVERYAISATVTGSMAEAFKAFALHPVVDSVNVARSSCTTSPGSSLPSRSAAGVEHVGKSKRSRSGSGMRGDDGHTIVGEVGLRLGLRGAGASFPASVEGDVSMATVGLIGTLDTKGTEYAWLVDQLAAEDCATLLVDVGTFSQGSSHADITSAEVAAAGGSSLEALRAADDRGRAMAVMASGSAAIVRALHAEGRIDALLAIGGSGGSSIAAEAMRALPVGVPKLLVSTMASGDVSPYVGESDMTLMYSVVDISGINRISRQVLGNAASAVAGMARRHEGLRNVPDGTDGKPLIGMTMFGLTTPAADEARARLDELGYEVLVFHATGSGGKAMESLVASGFLAGVLDLTTTELADELVGGVLTAGPHRLEAAAKSGTPQVVSVGALDMVNFGPRASVPTTFSERSFLVHNPTITLMRTTRAEMTELGTIIASKLSQTTGPAEVFLPLQGVSGIDVEGGPFADPDADRALFAAIRAGLKGTAVTVHDVPTAINDEGFGRQMAEALDQLIRTKP